MPAISIRIANLIIKLESYLALRFGAKKMRDLGNLIVPSAALAFTAPILYRHLQLKHLENDVKSRKALPKNSKCENFDEELDFSKKRICNTEEKLIEIIIKM
ncbi:MAG: hypothetical protein MHMPM18_004162 [Marteilia pararefringens]